MRTGRDNIKETVVGKRSETMTGILVVIGFLVAGCGSAFESIEVKNGLEDIWEENEEEGGGDGGDGAVSVNFAAAPASACLWKADEEGNVGRCADLFVGGSIEEAEAHIEQAVSAEEAFRGVVFEDLDATASEIVEARLRERYSQVTMTSSDEPSPGGIDVRIAEISYGACADDPMSHCAEVRLEILGGEGASFEGAGRGRQSGGHLGWIIPTIVLGFPVTVAIPAAIMRNVVRVNIISATVCRAIDDAAEKMAAGL